MKTIIFFSLLIFYNPLLAQISPAQQESVLKVINEIRKKGCKCGGTKYPTAPPLSIDGKLTLVAQRYADELAKRDVLSHTGKNGSKAADRIKKAGYNWSHYGENIAGGYNKISEVVMAWIESKGHCKTLMNPNYIHIGIGYRDTYWVTDFATPKNIILE